MAYRISAIAPRINAILIAHSKMRNRISINLEGSAGSISGCEGSTSSSVKSYTGGFHLLSQYSKKRRTRINTIPRTAKAFSKGIPEKINIVRRNRQHRNATNIWFEFLIWLNGIFTI
jgi:hypothetical protein